MSVGSGSIKRSKTAFVFIAQVRANIGGYGDTLSVVGGNAVKHYARLILEFRRGSITDEYKETLKRPNGTTYTKITGFPCIIKISKTNFAANESSQTVVPFMFDRGYDQEAADIASAITSGIVKRAGAYYKCNVFPEGKLLGKEAVFEFFRSNPDKLKQLLEDGVPEEVEVMAENE
jgi:RecA/RadA recombinase